MESMKVTWNYTGIKHYKSKKVKMVELLEKQEKIRKLGYVQAQLKYKNTMYHVKFS